MKKILLSVLLCIFIPLQACAQEQWKKDEHYEIINDTATSSPEVLEFFSFWCPHCHSFEPLVKSMKEKISKETKFEKIHVNFMGFTSAQIQDEATRGMMVGRALKRGVELNQAVFNYIHVQRSSLTSLNDVRNIYLVNGVKPEEFDKLAKSFGVNSMVQKNNKTIQEYRKHLSSVPTFIVNGKFKARFTRDMTPDDMVDLIVWLTKQK